MLEINGDLRPGIKPSILNLRVLAAASLFASKDETRYYLNGVCLEIEERGTTYVATDGHRIFAYREDILPDEKPNETLGTFIVPTAHCKHFKLNKDDLGLASIFQEFGRLTLAYGFVDVRFNPIDGAFVAWRRAIPPATTGTHGQFNLTLLADFQKVATALELPPPYVASNGPDKPALIWFAGRPEAMGCIMPMRFADFSHQQPPTWAKRGPDGEQSDIEDAIDDTILSETNVEDITKKRTARAAAAAS